MSLPGSCVERPNAVLVVENADEVVGMTAFTTLMMATRRPVVFNADVFVEGDGTGLMAYGVSLRERYRRAAAIAARVLDGAGPADVPVEQPTRYELVINLRAAEQYQIALPREFVQRADRVIRCENPAACPSRRGSDAAT